MTNGNDAQSQARLRLIDHFKRAYQIVVGLAITNACSKLLPGGVADLSGLPFWQFCTFFITVVPIFHGGDRSLDIKYLGTSPTGRRRLSYVWDVYMLLITAILFVKISQSIPGASVLLASASNNEFESFYNWMGAMLLFDVFVLVVDGVKSRTLGMPGAQELNAYFPWLALNSLLAIFCFIAAYLLSYQMVLEPLWIGIVVFVCAFFRTVLDYLFGQNFLFP